MTKTNKDMNTYIKIILFFGITLLINNFAHAQTSVNSSGGEATGSNGAVSYSIGQPFFRMLSEQAGATVEEGIQHASVQITPGAGNILYVKKGAAGNGSSWEKAVGELADALKWVRRQHDADTNWLDGDSLRIFVAKGTYYPMYSAEDGLYANDSGSDNSFVMIKNVQLYGGFDPDNGIDTIGQNRIMGNDGAVLSGDIGTLNDSLDNAYHVVISAGDIGNGLLDGFVIRDGNATGSNSTVSINSIAVNRTYGGGMINISSSPCIANVSFYKNTSKFGAGMFNNSSSPILLNVVFEGNRAATNGGGGMRNTNFSDPVLMNVYFIGNTANSGGGIYNTNSSPILANVLFAGNVAVTYGGGMNNETSSSPVLRNVTISGNTAGNTGDGIRNYLNSEPKIYNSIIWGNGSSNMNNSSTSSSEFYNSLIEGSGGSTSWTSSFGTDGGGNIDTNPQFAGSGDYSLQNTSPAINAGNNSYYAGSLSSDTDLAGNPRVYDYAGGGIIDMGAYEYNGCIPVTVPDTVVACDSFVWIDGITYTASNDTASYTLSSSTGCDSIITLHLTINPTLETALVATICSNETYSFGGATLGIAGIYSDTLTAASGCDSIVTLTLNVNPVLETFIAAAICSNETYNFGGATLSTSGTYSDTLTTASGCDSIVTLTLNVNPVLETALSTTICSNETYSFGGATLSVAGNYSDTLTAASGCDSIVTLTLNVNPVLETALAATICSNETYSFGGATLSVSGTYSDTLTAASGCDSIVTLTLNVNPVLETALAATICSNETYSFGGATLSTSGTYSDTLTTASGCDSIITLTLSVNPVLETALAATICSNETHSFGGEDLSISGVYSDTLTAASGCDSIVTLTLNVNPVLETALVATICSNETYSFGGEDLSISGVYFDTLTSASGCDSIITLTLSVNPVLETAIAATICSNETYSFGGATLTTSGTYSDTLTAASGCDSIITLTLNVNPVLETALAATICSNETYSFGGVALTTSGTYADTLTTASGCDSIVTLTLNVNPVLETALAATICSNETYSFGGATLSVAGIYPDTLIAASGCDSIVTLTLNVNPVLETALAATICSNETYSFGGATLSVAGIYPDTLIAASGCDSIVTLTLNVNPVLETALAATICSNETYSFDGEDLSVAGIYSDTLTAASGCDSIVTLTLTVNPVLETALAAIICSNESYSFGGTTLTTSGTYADTLTAASGCDSIITLTLSVNPVLETAIAAAICSNETYSFGGATLTISGTYADTLTAASGCDSIVTLTLTVNPVLETAIAATICSNESYSFGGSTLSVAGNYSDTLTAASGCDSIVILTLTVNPVLETALAATICSNETYSFGGATLSVSGTYADTLTAASGCDSIVTLTLNVNPVLETALAATICSNETYSFGGATLTTSGTYADTLTAASGCDSIVTLTLTVNPVLETALAATICSNETYSFGGATLSVAGIYSDTLTAATGCDSIVTLTLSVNPVLETALAATICSNETYSFGGATLTTSGTYADTLTAASGCDSIVTLTLNVNPVLETALVATICSNETYSFGGLTLTTSGTYADTLTSVSGCDSIVTLTLNVHPAPTPTTVVASNPTTCGGSDGSITIEGLVAGTTYTIAYEKDGIAQGPQSVTADGSGNAVLGTLSSGAYTNIIVTNTTTTCSAASALSATLSDPVFTITATASDNTDCSVPDGTITITSPLLISGASYNWNYNGISGTETANSSAEIVLNGLNASTYTDVWIHDITTGCTSDTIASITVGGTPISDEITPADASDSKSQSGGSVDYNNAGCERIVTIDATNGNLGTVTAAVEVIGAVGTYNDEFYFGRVYHLSASNNVGGTVTLYFSDAEIAAYNAAVGSSTPDYPVVATDGSNIMITAFHSTPGSGGGPLGYDTATSELISPSSIIHNLNGYYEITFSVSSFSGFFATTNSSAPLPVKLSAISAINSGATNRVDWSTTNESNGDRFVVERSADARSFQSIGTMNAKGISGSRYSLVDAQPFMGTNYYRVEILNNDGSRFYSKVVSAVVSTDGLHINAYPNPVKDELTATVSGMVSGKGILILTDISGRELSRTDIESNGIVILPMEHLSQGMYLLKYQDDATTQIIKVNKE